MANKLRIVHVLDTLDPDAGGVAAVAPRLAAAAALAGHDVTLVASEDSDRAAVIDETLGGIRGAELIRSARVGSARGIVEQVGAVLPQADVVHMHGVWEPFLLKVAALARAANKVSVLSPHGMLDPWSLRQKRFKKMLALMLGYRKMLESVSFLHVLNGSERDLMPELKAPAEVIPNGIDFAELALEELGDAELPESPYLLFLSRLHYKKGLDLLAEAFADGAAEHNGRLVVAGPDDGALGDFQNRLDRRGVRGRVDVVGPVYGGVKAALLRGAKGFVLPSRQEGFSVAILEAMGSGLPVVITKACHFEDVATKDAGWVVELDRDQLARAIVELMTQDSSRRGQNGKRLIEEQYTWQAVSDSIIAAYLKYLAR